MIRKVTWYPANDNYSKIPFSLPTFPLIEPTGLGEIEADIQTQKAPFQDGSTLIDQLLEDRVIELDFMIRGSNLSELKRRVSRAFNPKDGLGTLQVETDEQKYEIKAVPTITPSYPGGNAYGPTWQSALVELLCPDPTFYDLEYTTKQAVGFEGGFSFNMEFPINFGSTGANFNLENEGDVETPLRIKFYGPMDTPKITNNNTDEFIEVNQEIGEDEYLEIYTGFGEKSVELVSNDGDRESVFNFINLESNFFQLQPGDNELVYTALSEGEGAYVEIEFKNRYLGV